MSVSEKSDKTSTQDSERDATGGSDKEPTEEDVQRKPWKYIGYRGYANFIASDDNFFVLRRFDRLNARMALALQDEISELEEQLEAIDKRRSRRDAEDINNGTLRGDRDEDRVGLLRIISKRLRRYNEFILQQPSLRGLSLAPRRNVKSIDNWHFNHDYAAIAAAERAYLHHTEDLVSMAPKDKTPVRAFIDHSLRLRTLAFWRHRDDEVPAYDAGVVTYYSDKRMGRFSSAVIILVGVAMLITPIWVLQALDSLQSKLGVITAFILVFLLVLSVAMVAKPFEALAATAAYGAVLMVFIQLGTDGS